MKIIIEDPNKEIRITVEDKEMPMVLEEIISVLKAGEKKGEQRENFLALHSEDGKVLVPVEEIYYCESVEGKVYVYCADKMFTSTLKLYELEKVLPAKDFVRISKQMLVDIRKIKLISANGTAQLVATLKNEEKVVVSRQFVGKLKERVGL